MNHNCTVLLVDDEKIVLDVLKRTLNDEYEVLTAENGMQALKILEQGRVDLILSDITMPGMSGI